MAKQAGIIKIKGLLDGLSFYEDKHGFQVRRKGGASKERIYNDPSMKRTWENASEFKYTMQAVKLFKPVLLPFLRQFKDGDLHSRMVSFFRSLVDLDTVSERGQRRVAVALSLLLGQEALLGHVFTRSGGLDRCLKRPYIFNWDMTGVVWNRVVGKEIKFPAGATHLKLEASYVVYDLSQQQVLERVLTPPFYVSRSFDGAVVLVPGSVPSVPGLRVGVVFGQFVQELNGQFYPFKETDQVFLEVGGCFLPPAPSEGGGDNA